MKRSGFINRRGFINPSFRARVFTALVGVSAATCLIIGLVLYYFAESRLVEEEQQSLVDRSRLANASAGDFLEGLRNPESETFPEPQTYADELVQSIANPTGLGVLYVGPNGPLAARRSTEEPLVPEEVYEQLQLTPEIFERAEQSSQGTGRIYPRDGWPRYLTVWPLQSSDGVVRGSIVYYAPQEDLDQTLSYLRFGILGAIGTGILLAGAASLLLTRQITQPLSLTRDAAIRVASGDYSVVPVKNQDELGEVAAAFNYMAQEIERNVQEIQEQKSRLEAVLEASPEAVVAIDPDERVTMANPAAARMLNISPDQLGRRFGENGVPNGVMECLRIALDTGAAVREAESGGRVYWAYAAQMIRPEDDAERGPGVILAVRDITEYRSLERAKTAFISDLSHEIRTPLTTIQSAMGIVGSAEDQLSAGQRRAIQLAEQELGRIRSMVEELLTLAQMDSQQYSLELGPTDIEQVILDAIESIQSKAERFGITIEIDLDEGHHTCPGDSRKLYQVFLNLLDNAVKYSESGARVRVSIEESGEEIQAVVSDTGLGIPEEDLPQLFDRFYRVDKARSRASGGSGLGLSIVREIVELHGGRVAVRSKLGEGSTFTVSLPLTPTAKPADYAR